jgi:hypothetical protein
MGFENRIDVSSLDPLPEERKLLPLGMGQRTSETDDGIRGVVLQDHSCDEDDVLEFGSRDPKKTLLPCGA